MRGPVLAEIESIVQILDKRRASFAPANPFQKPPIQDGIYWAEGQPFTNKIRR